MAVFKCKMCGGTIEFEKGATVGVCDSCGTKQTLPRIDDDKKENLYDRASHFRRNNDFDKAMGIYEQILNDDNTDAEAYWSLVLCRYGIEYVEDPSSHKRIPTINRAQFTSIYMDEDYKSAIQYADLSQKQIYEEEAKAIDDIQKGILEISSKEEPFDVFICYKETDSQGRRTPDSVLATELYHELTKEGFKVFFSRITLEDKLGVAYEPYIFAALNSAKVMVALGTKPEYFNAVWVRNEWNRYLALIKNGAKKMLIPAYRDMNPYDLPEEFSHLQAQDMAKLGFMQDLIHGIKKIISVDEPKKNVVDQVASNYESTNIAPLLRRVAMFLEDENWEDANKYCERILDLEPENAHAYLGKLMAELKVKTQGDLKNCEKPFDNLNNYQKVCRFDGTLAEQLKSDIDYINKRNENAKFEAAYNKAVASMKIADSEELYKSAATTFQNFHGFKDSDSLAEECLKKAESCRKDKIYSYARVKMNAGRMDSYEEAIETFQMIPGWKDVDEQVVYCQKKIEEIKLKEESEKYKNEYKLENRKIKIKKNKKVIKLTAIIVPTCCAFIAFVILMSFVIIPKQKLKKALKNDSFVSGLYDDAIALYNDGKYEEAIIAFEALNGYKDSAMWVEKCRQEGINVGDTIIFGSYEQDNNTSNGKENIEWLVLMKKDNKILVVSVYGLDCKQYNTSNSNVTWETSSVRKWLNGTFINKAFSAEEQAKIESTIVSADINPKYSTNPGNDTTDKVFLLSITEVNKYFSSEEDRKCIPTAYAISRGAYTSSSYTKGGEATCWWWLRSPGCYQNYAADVSIGGSVYDPCIAVNSDDGCVRPTMWINLDF